MSVKILDYYIYSETKMELIEYLRDIKHKVHIVSGNPEVLYSGLSNLELKENFKSEEAVIIPDGIGTVLSAKILGTPVQEKIAGIEVMEEIIKFCEDESKPIYLLGAKQEILDKCISNLKMKHPRLEIVGSHNGYFNIDECETIIKDIEVKMPYCIFVAMGAPRQEIFITKYMHWLPCTIFMGVGGSFDVISGNSKRAPKWMIKIGIEWLYRVLKEPWRLKRLSSIPKFIYIAVLNRNN
ncbi:WecB/TagA/CpsF family glycosyltransferase [Clostridium omnivorum]|uniref:N-acetylglucosaminyldiphosphoundecaprenol N-acetyl-beta-D-mannosaminyltransferase n=1 Tax=Clostridium omnivorum TaxID=1604902 RepID=A0ABQ5N0E9_9CLOT|nr:WecB/TagA/CpsF family glycosyltransferase [Clostridium sp. E14]GLC28672.1 UDP-N-acetyl-D-mannosaminuronic acid transferase [Clostridium sp. E14]